MTRVADVLMRPIDDPAAAPRRAPWGRSLDYYMAIYLTAIGLDKALHPYVKATGSTWDSTLELRHPPLVSAIPFREELVEVYNKIYDQRVLEKSSEAK